MDLSVGGGMGEKRGEETLNEISRTIREEHGCCREQEWVKKETQMQFPHLFMSIQQFRRAQLGGLGVLVPECPRTSPFPAVSTGAEPQGEMSPWKRWSQCCQAIPSSGPLQTQSNRDSQGIYAISFKVVWPWIACTLENGVFYCPFLHCVRM